jgi:hypothetical protein
MSAPIEVSAMLLMCSVLLLGRSSFSNAFAVKLSRAPRFMTNRANVSCFSTRRSSSGKCTPYHSRMRPINKFSVLSKSSNVWIACPTTRSRFSVAPLTCSLATSTLMLRDQVEKSLASLANPVVIANSGVRPCNTSI